MDTIPGLVAIMTAQGEVELVNQQVLDYFGRTLDDLKRWGTSDAVHPDDLPAVLRAWSHAVETGTPYEFEHRIRRADGVYRWFQSRGRPLRDGEGKLFRWYNLLTDVDDRRRVEELQVEARLEIERAYEEIRRLKDRLQDENVALREELTRASMFEEIVGSSPALQATLTSLAMVAPTDSTVVILGETGTGKELVARAIHKRSRRADRAFVSVNCAAIPPALIASELFGHEKGAFTSAMQQRRGRFELAHQGTIFLDEIGDVPIETQLALLRVLQERQFERVGGVDAVSVDVRVIVATNRDLAAAVAAGTFRADLFYRLNVFPIEVPPLRERLEDVSLLVAYFVKRFADKMGKRIHEIDPRALELCESYAWPGNIRELQNIVERSVILCTGDTFTIDEAWLPRGGSGAGTKPALPHTLKDQERELIEAALTRSRGRVSGSSGAAAKLGIPASTLESKIRQLGIDKRKFTPDSQ